MNVKAAALHVCNMLVVGTTIIALEYVAGSHGMERARRIKFLCSYAR